MKEEPDDFLQLIQWHMSFLNGRPAIVNSTALQRHDPFVIGKTLSESCVDWVGIERERGEATMITGFGLCSNRCVSLKMKDNET